MGIDLYLHDDQGNELAYVRESYFAVAYATEALVPESWGHHDDERGIQIPAALMASRMEMAAHAAHERARGDTEYERRHVTTLVAFVEAAKAYEAEHGHPAWVLNSY